MPYKQNDHWNKSCRMVVIGRCCTDSENQLFVDYLFWLAIFSMARSTIWKWPIGALWPTACVCNKNDLSPSISVLPNKWKLKKLLLNRYSSQHGINPESIWNLGFEKGDDVESIRNLSGIDMEINLEPIWGSIWNSIWNESKIDMVSV